MEGEWEIIEGEGDTLSTPGRDQTSIYPALGVQIIARESSWSEDKPDLDLNHATTFVYNPNVSLSLEQQRQRLPIYTNRSHILYLLERFQTLVLVGETGCGKSTQVPQVRHSPSPSPP
uniref:Uncharacterized protein n=1 Tax=Timema genevievae TaxID=629358 RepID=A0A7R9JWP9_TIMGE|nr:unnamed protein product [Timema genevievae]